MMIKRLFTYLYNLLFPQRCAVCRRRLAADEQFCCTVCQLRLSRTNFAKTPYDNEMARLLWGLIPVEKVAAYFFYRPKAETSRLIHQLKYYNQPYVGFFLAEMLSRERDFQDFFQGIDAIVPVPITKARKRNRGYNQSDAIAEGLHYVTHLPIVYDAVERLIFRESQTNKRHSERIENVEGAFRLKNAAAIENKHLLLVDDVMTTGSTICECARQLLMVNGVKISILTLSFTKS